MYQNVLAALDFSENSRKVLNSALRLSNGDASKIHLIHVVQPVSEGYALNVYTQNFQALEDEAIEQATSQLKEFENSDNIPAGNLHTVLGDRAGEIRKLATELDSEVIVIGSHGHSGAKRMLGTTANKLLHGADCDVLTVHATGS